MELIDNCLKLFKFQFDVKLSDIIDLSDAVKNMVKYKCNDKINNFFIKSIL